MANILDYLRQIKDAVYGKDVRSSIYNALYEMNDQIEKFVEIPDGSVTPEKTTFVSKGTDGKYVLRDDFKINDQIELLGNVTQNLNRNLDGVAGVVGQEVKRNDAQDRLLDVHDRSLNALWDINEGQTYRVEEDSTPAYSKTMPPYAKSVNVNMLGGKTIVWNQLNQEIYDKAAVSSEKLSERSYKITSNVDVLNVKQIRIKYVTPILDHVYYFSAYITGDGTNYAKLTLSKPGGSYDIATETGWTMLNTTKTHHVAYGKNTFAFTNDDIKGAAVGFAVRLKNESPSGAYCIVENIQLFDLTQMFGAGNEPTREEFEAMFPADYYPYSEPTLLSADVDKVVSVGVNVFNYNNAIKTQLYPTSDKLATTPTGYSIAYKLEKYTTYSISKLKSSRHTLGIAKELVDGVPCLRIDNEHDSLTFTTTDSTWLIWLIWNQDGDTTLTFEDIAESIVLVKGNSIKQGIKYVEETHIIPSSILSLPGYGLSVGDVYNEVDFVNKKYIQRVKSIDLGDISFEYRNPSSDVPVNYFRSSGFTYYALTTSKTRCDRYRSSSRGSSDDLTYAKWNASNTSYFIFKDSRYSDARSFEESVRGLNFIYVLENPIVTDISDIIGHIEVEEGGTLTFENTNGNDFRIPVSNTTAADIDMTDVYEKVHRDVNELKQDVDSLEDRTIKQDHDIEKNSRSLSALWDLNEGKTYRFEEDSTPAYSKTMSSGSRLTDVNKLGGKTIAWNELRKDTGTTTVHGVTFSTSNSVTHATGKFTTQSGQYRIMPAYSEKTIIDHKYLVNFKTISGKPGSGIFKRSLFNLVNIEDGQSYVVKAKSEIELTPILTMSGIDTDETIDWIFVSSIFDLTQMFGVDNEPTAEEFEAMFPADYYPYSKPTLISAEVDKVVSIGKNIWDPTDYSELYKCEPPVYIGDGVYKTVANAANAYITYKINVEKGKQYRIICNILSAEGPGNSQTFRVCSVYDGNSRDKPTLLNSVSFYAGSMAKLFIPSSNTILVKVILSGGGGSAVGYINGIQIWETSAATIYNSGDISYYSPNRKSISEIPSSILSLPGYGWSTRDAYNEVDFVNKKYIQRVNKVVINGNAGWTTYEDKVIIRTPIIQLIPDAKDYSATQTVYKAISNYGVCGNIDGNGGIVWHHTSGVYWLVYNETTTVESAINKFNSEPIILYYELAEPIITDISDVLDSIDVEAGGTLTFENTHGDDFRIPVPNTTETVVKLSEVTA